MVAFAPLILHSNGADADSSVVQQAHEGASIDFNREIRPILSENCFFCHGPDANLREAGLRLDVAEEAIGSVITPGDGIGSELVRRLVSKDPDSVMPPHHTGRSLSKEQIELLTRWIDSGATYQQHWSFTPPLKSPTPEFSSNAFGIAESQQIEKAWLSNPVDRFLLQKMQEIGLTPNPTADRATLIRRITFDLTGLPPTLDEIDRFLVDDSPAAYEELVDRLLASPAFGERLAADWLDVARYSDSYGMQVDKDRRVWPYRDWVTTAFNQGFPYDRFLTEQLAGDLIPEATRDQVLATTFNRLHPQESEGGSVPEEFLAEYIADRVQTVATAFLGLTLECCRCHDHKYDPISQQEYFQLSSYFDNIDEAGLYSYFTDSVPTPALDLPTPDQELEFGRSLLRVMDLEKTQGSLNQVKDARFQDWLKTLCAENGQASGANPTVGNEGSTQVVSPVTIAGEIVHMSFDDLPAWDGENGNDAENANGSVDGVVGRAARLGGDEAIEVGVGNFHRWEPFTVSLWLQVDRTWDRAVVFHRSRAWTDAGSRGYELLIDQGHLQASLIHFWPGDQVSVRSRQPLPTKAWQHVAITWDGSSRAAGLRLFLDGQPIELEVVRDNLTREITGGGGDTLQIGARFRDRGLQNGWVDEFRVFNRQLSELEVGELYEPGSLTRALQSHTQSDMPEQVAGRLRDFYLLSVDSDFADEMREIREARQRFSQVSESIEQIMVLKEMTTDRQSYVLERGMYDSPGEPVESATPSALLPWKSDLTNNRLGLAGWMCEPEHPLTSRVAVNRLWQTIFGRGLVSTPEDFGNQGSVPSHPELLDWLAVEMIEHDWDVKFMLRLLVTSSAYRQAAASPNEVDPENIYLARAAQYRWPAEMLRDQALAVSGLLSRRMGGAPVRPYEVEKAFKPVARDQGEGLYRRSLYTYWNRTGPAPALTTLDASLRDVCRVKREQTATPLQSLVIWNSPQFVEAAREIACRMLVEHPNDLEASLQTMFRLLTSRPPNDRELELLQKLYQDQREVFQSEPKKAEAWLMIGERRVAESLDKTSLAALASVANALFNYDGCVTKR